MLEQGEALWDVAKAYGTTINDIISVNELSDESAAAGKLLLIIHGFYSTGNMEGMRSGTKLLIFI